MENIKISWTENMVNFWVGCNKVSPGCKYCYMHRMMEVWGKDPNHVRRVMDKTFYAALGWKDPRMIFTCSMSDYFIQDADPWRDDAWSVIRRTPQHQWQVLTKRIERVSECLPNDWAAGYENVWLGTSVENQFFLDRIEMLANIPARIRLISFEPLLGPIDLSPLADSGALSQIHWGILGGESGNDTGRYRYRPCESPGWKTFLTSLIIMG